MQKAVKTAVALAALLASGPALAWEPTKTVEIVVAAGAGGASDQMARMMQAAIQKNKLIISRWSSRSRAARRAPKRSCT